MLRMRGQIMQRWMALIRQGIGLVGADTPAVAWIAERAAFFEFVSAELPEVFRRWDEYRGPRRILLHAAVG